VNRNVRAPYFPRPLGARLLSYCAAALFVACPYSNPGPSSGVSVAAQASRSHSKCPSEVVQVHPGVDSAYGILRSADNGKTWEKVVDDSGFVDAMAVDGSGHLFAGTGGFAVGRGMHLGLLESTDDGVTWRRIVSCPGVADLTDVRSIAIDSSDTIYAAGGRGVVSSSDSGQNWNSIVGGLVEGTQRNVQAVIVAPQAGLIGGTYDGVVRFLASQQRWFALALKGVPVTSLASNSGGDIYAGTNTGILRSSDHGLHWTPVNGIRGPATVALDFQGNMFASLPRAGILRSMDSGVTWKNVLSAGKETATYGVSVSQGGAIFASVGACCPVSSVGLFRSTNGGNGWTKILNLKNGVAAGVVTLTRNNTILVGLSGIGE
jgi:hypothetical protein